MIHTFTGGDDGGGGSASRLLVDSAGNLIGVCTVGGANGFGTVFTMSLHQGQWQLTTLYAFKDSPDGGLPYGGLIADKAGNLYGTTYYAGANDLGTVYSSESNSVWNEHVLYSFKGGSDGGVPSVPWWRMRWVIFTAPRVKVGLQPAGVARFSRFPRHDREVD